MSESPTHKINEEQMEIANFLRFISENEMKNYYFNQTAFLKEHYLSNIEIIEQKKRKALAELENWIRQNADTTFPVGLGLVLDFLFEDRFELYIHYFKKIKHRDMRRELTHQALFSAQDSIPACNLIALALADKSKLVIIEAIEAAAYSLNDALIGPLKLVNKKKLTATEIEDINLAITSIKLKNADIFFNQNNSDNFSWSVNRWDNKENTGYREYLLAGQILRNREVIETRLKA